MQVYQKCLFWKKTGCFVSVNTYVWGLYNKNQWALTENEICFRSTIKSILWIDWKSNPFSVVGIADWPKVTNIYTTHLALQNVLITFLLPGTWWKKFPTFYKVLKTRPPQYRRSHKVHFECLFWFGEWEFCRFAKFTYIFRPTKCTFILYIFRPT